MFIDEVKQYADETCINYLVGNKIDLIEGNEKLRKVPKELAQNFATKNNLKYFETSCWSNINVSEVFEDLILGNDLK